MQKFFWVSETKSLGHFGFESEFFSFALKFKLWHSEDIGAKNIASPLDLDFGLVLKATIGISEFLVFLHQFTFPNMGKVVSCLLEFLIFLSSIWLYSACYFFVFLTSGFKQCAMASSDFRCTQVGFQLIPVQLCTCAIEIFLSV